MVYLHMHSHLLNALATSQKHCPCTLPRVAAAYRQYSTNECAVPPGDVHRQQPSPVPSSSWYAGQGGAVPASHPTTTGMPNEDPQRDPFQHGAHANTAGQREATHEETVLQESRETAWELLREIEVSTSVHVDVRTVSYRCLRHLEPLIALVAPSLGADGHL